MDKLRSRVNTTLKGALASTTNPDVIRAKKMIDRSSRTFILVGSTSIKRNDMPQASELEVSSVEDNADALTRLRRIEGSAPFRSGSPATRRFKGGKDV
jgi:hypothetical protein